MLAHEPRTAAVRRLLTVGVTAACAVLPAHAQGSVQADRTAAALVMRQLDRLDARRAELVHRRSSARARLDGLVTAIGVTKVTIADEQAQIAGARSALAAEIVGDYKAGAPDATTYVLGAVSFADLADRMDVLDRIDASEVALIRRISGETAGLKATKARLQGQIASQRGQIASVAAATRRIDSAIAGRHHLLASITARMRARLAAEQARRERLAQSDGGTTSGGGGGGGGGTPSGRVFYGDCTWYGPGFAGDPTASGEIFDPHKLTAASPWLPFNTILHVTSTVTGKSVTVRVNDRGPFGHGVLDLSQHAARIIGLEGWQRVRIEIVSEP
jgi:peptidoglycan hydrolase CwlO-like protein